MRSVYDRCVGKKTGGVSRRSVGFATVCFLHQAFVRQSPAKIEKNEEGSFSYFDHHN